MLNRVEDFLRSLFSRRPVRLAIVRRYADANGSYVGELYMEQERNGVSSYCMIGASLDTLPLDVAGPQQANGTFFLDTKHDFLFPMLRYTVRVGALDPQDNDRIRAMVAKLPTRRVTLVVQNRFIQPLNPCGPLAYNLMSKKADEIIREFDKP